MTRPLVLLHGFTGSPSSWGPILTELGGEREVIALPLLGHAPTLVEGPEITFDDELDRIAARIAALGGPVDLVGYSLGAREALGTLVRHPDRVVRTLLIGVHPGLRNEVERAARAATDQAWIDRLQPPHGLDRFVEAWERLPLFESQQRLPAKTRAAQRAERLRHDPAGLARSLRVTGLAAMPSYWDALEAFAGRLTLAVGEHDAKFRGLADEVRARTGLPVNVVAAAGHNVPLERPEAVIELVREVLP